MKNRYDGPLEAFTSIFLIASEFAVKIATAPVIVTAVVGAVVAGLLTEVAAKHWR